MGGGVARVLYDLIIFYESNDTLWLFNIAMEAMAHL